MAAPPGSGPATCAGERALCMAERGEAALLPLVQHRASSCCGWEVEYAVPHLQRQGLCIQMELYLARRGFDWMHGGVPNIVPRTPPARPVEQVTITAQREICEGQAILPEYEVGNRVWQRAAAVLMGAIRTYEMDLLPLREPLLKQPDARGADPRRGTPEASVGRKSAGILAAVSPCMRVVAVQPMYATESQGQAVSFVDDILQMLPRTAWVTYDFACGIRRHIRAQLSLRLSKPEASRWQALDALTWVVDKMHFKTHKGCRKPQSPWYEPSVNPYVPR